MKNCRSLIEFAHLNNRWFLRKEFCSIVLNRSEHPNGCCFRKPIVFIDVFNPHKSSTLNRLTSTPSSMPFISNFDFSYPKCHVFESHCRYQRFQSRCSLGWIIFMQFYYKIVLFMSKCRNFGISALFLSHLQ